MRKTAAPKERVFHTYIIIMGWVLSLLRIIISNRLLCVCMFVCVCVLLVFVCVCVWGGGEGLN